MSKGASIIENPHATTLLDVRNLKKYFPIEKGLYRRTVGYVRAVDDVSFTVRSSEVLGLVGESGCGKTTTGKTVIRAYEPTGGEILFRPHDEMVDMAGLSRKDLRPIREKIQMIFQDPYSSLSPRLTIQDIIAEPLRAQGKRDRKHIEQQVGELVEMVGLKRDYLRRYPHAFSGGQRQRIGIARALALRPRLIVADEPVSALDVSVQAQVLNLLQSLQRTLGLSFLFISHDLSVVRHISSRIAVMYVGKLLELAHADSIFVAPMHPYTETLLSAIPVPDPRMAKAFVNLEGEAPNPADPPSGCYFHPRCPYAQRTCSQDEPELVHTQGLSGEDHLVKCHFPLSQTDSIKHKG